MTRGSINCRLERLEARTLDPPRSSYARERMTRHLRQLARLRRGELEPQEATEVRATHAAIEDRLASRRGEGTS